jgi:hypothetical protein
MPAFLPDQCAQRTDGQLLVLGYGKIGADTGFNYHDVTANLTDLLPSGALECLYRLSS